MTARLILDGMSLAAGAKSESARPTDQLQVLDRYGSFGRREKIPVTVLFVGKPLRELDAEGCYREMAVRYVERREDLPSLLQSILKTASCAGTVVVTGMDELESVAISMGAAVMRDMTLRKVLDRSHGDRGAGSSRPPRNRGGGGGGRGGGGGSGGGGGGGNGGDGNGKSPAPVANPNAQSRSRSESAPEPQRRPSADTSAASRINDLIDTV